MRRLLRWAFNGAAAVSAVLFVGACVLWVRSQGRYERATLTSRSGWWRVVSKNGKITLAVVVGWSPPAEGYPYGLSVDSSASSDDIPDFYQGPQPYLPNLRYRHLGGLGLATLDRPPAEHFVDFIMPHWFLAAGLALFLLTCALRHHRRVRRSRPAPACRVCGYDLRATPERCPECGTEGAVPKRS